MDACCSSRAVAASVAASMMGQGLDIEPALVVSYPIEPYKVDGYRFGQFVRSRVILFARHLGDDIIAPAKTPVRAVADGRVVWSEVRPGTEERRNWGGIVILAHKHKDTGHVFYTVYGHVTAIAVQKGDSVSRGQVVAAVAAGSTPQNGWWKQAHLHFGVYAGPWTGKVLPGYFRPFEGRTKVRWWEDPGPFLTQYGLAPTDSRMNT